jgi:2,3-bisphosphoglycerate-dependent phosphoglycerate mutase
MSTFYLVRHAHADWTPDENRPLSARGYKDALRVADILQRYPIHVIYSSPFCRARQTIAPLAARLELPVHEEPGLRERQLGGEPDQDFFEAVEKVWRNPSFAHSGGESNSVAQERGQAVVRWVRELHPTEHIVLSTHGNLLALLLQGFDPSIDFTFWKSMTMPDIYVLSFGPDGRPSRRRLWSDVVPS